MLETSNSFDAMIVTTMCITAVLKQEQGFEIENYKGTIFTHIIKTGDTKIINIEPGFLGNNLQKTFDIGIKRDDSEMETYRNGHLA